MPALPSKAAETTKELITPPRPSAPTQKTAESAPRAATPTQQQPPAPPVKTPAPPAVISIDVLPPVEAAIKQALRQENSNLHFELRKKGAPSDSITWIDAFLAVAEDKYKEDSTPFGKMAQVYLHPLYLRAAHADRRKASEMVDHVASFFIRLKSHNDAAVRRFSIDILERYQGEEKDKATQLISGKSRQQREVFDQSHSETLRRLDSAARQNGTQGRR